jgi:hypothetical protein
MPAKWTDEGLLTLRRAGSDAIMLRDALAGGNAVFFIYDGKERIVEVHAIGTSTKDGSIIFRGYQVAGKASRPLPQWTLFSLDKVEGLNITFINSEAPREGYAMDDKQMAAVLCQLDIR